MQLDLGRRIGERVEGLRLAFAERFQGKTVRVGPWLPLAMVEDDDFTGAEGPPLTAERMRWMVQNFAPAQLLPPIITGTDGGSHYQGKYLDPLGHITEVEFDGLTLWGKPSEICDYGASRVEGAVATGRFKRSIEYLYSPDGNPSATYLSHLALTGGEREAQPGLLPLTHAYPDALPAEDSGAESVAEGELPAYAASRFGGREMKCGHRTFPAPDAPRQENEMDDAALTKLLGGFRTDIQTDTVAGIKAAVEPLNLEIASLKADLATASALATRTATDARKAGYRTALDTLTGEGRVSPGEVDPTLEALMALPVDAAEKLIAGMRTRPPMLGRFALAPLVVGEGAGAVPIESLMQGDPIQPGELSHRAAQRFSEVVAAAGGPDGLKTRESLMAALLRSGAHPNDGAAPIN